MPMSNFKMPRAIFKMPISIFKKDKTSTPSDISALREQKVHEFKYFLSKSKFQIPKSENSPKHQYSIGLSQLPHLSLKNSNEP